MTHRTFISLILAGAIAVTGITAAPARAGDDDIAKWIAGAAALAIIGAAIADNDRSKKKVVTRNYYKQYDHGHRHGNLGHSKKRHKRYPGFTRGDQFKLPSQCRRDVQTRRGYIKGFGRRCLLNNYGHYNSLPHQCAVKTRDYSGKRRVIYSGRCLGQYGYRVAGRNRR